MFPLTSQYLSAVEDRIAGEIIPNVDACKRWVEATGGGGGDVELARAARSLRWRLDQLCGRLDALQHAARVIDRHGGPEQECGSSATATTTENLSHTSAFRHGIPGRPVSASQPANSAVAGMAAVDSGDFARLTDDSHGSFHDVAMHREIATTSQQSFRGPDCSTMQQIPCFEGIDPCDQILPSPLSDGITFLFPHHSLADIGVSCAEASISATEASLAAHPVNMLDNELPLSTHGYNPSGPAPNIIQFPEIKNSICSATQDAVCTTAGTRPRIANSRPAGQRMGSRVMPVRANIPSSGPSVGRMVKIRSTALGARCSRTAPIEIDSGSESEATSDGSVSAIEGKMSLPGVDPHFLCLVDKANASCNLPEGTLRRFLPGCWLNDINIIETVRMLVPGTAEPLIAEHAIQNFPEGGLAQSYTPTELQDTSLKHQRDSTLLFIAYNVPNGSLNCTKKDHKDHWVLIIVSVLTSKVHIFGTETGLEDQAEALAENIGMFVNNHRRGFDDHPPPLKWSKPTLEPLYPLGIAPDTYNCGIAVISRAEAFLHPERALKVQANTTPSELGQQLNKKRSEYLRLFTDRYKALHTTKKLYDQITPPTTIPTKRLAIDHPLTGRPETAVKRSYKWLSNYATPQFLSVPRLSKPELWKKCIMTCAEANGFNAEGVFQAFQISPEHAVEDVLRILQCICEVANPERLIILKRLLSQGNTEPFHINSTSTSSDAETLWQLHCLVNKFTAVDQPILIFKSLFCLLCYYECHESAVSSWRKELKLGRANRKLRRDRERGQNGSHARLKQDLNRPRRTAEQQIRAALVERLREAGDSVESAQEEIRKNLQNGKKLKLLLHGRNPLWMLLILIEADGSSVLRGNKRPPALNLMEFNPPMQWRKLSEPISTTELLEVTERLAIWFGESFFTARPELKGIDLTDLDIFGNTCNQIRLCSTSDEEIHGTTPNDIAKLFH